MKKEILEYIEEKEETGLVGKFQAEFGDRVFISNVQEELESSGYVTEQNKEWVRLSTDNPLKSSSRVCRELFFLPAPKYYLKHYNYYRILKKREKINQNDI
jgi:hypothetical protein